MKTKLSVTVTVVVDHDNPTDLLAAQSRLRKDGLHLDVTSVGWVAGRDVKRPGVKEVRYSYNMMAKRGARVRKIREVVE